MLQASGHRVKDRKTTIGQNRNPSQGGQTEGKTESLLWARDGGISKECPGG